MSSGAPMFGICDAPVMTDCAFVSTLAGIEARRSGFAAARVAQGACRAQSGRAAARRSPRSPVSARRRLAEGRRAIPARRSRAARARPGTGRRRRRRPVREDGAMSPPWAPTPGTRNAEARGDRPDRRQLVGRRRPDDEADRAARSPARDVSGDAQVERLGGRAVAGSASTVRPWNSAAAGLEVRHRT